MAQWFSYPFTEVSKLECRTLHWDQHPDSCKIPLPRIVNQDYDKFINEKVFRDIYTVLYKGSYSNGWARGQGSHPGIDIATAEGTPIMSIGDGTVTFAGRGEWYGNVVRVKHAYQTGFIYATYAHLSKILVTTGQTVKQWEIIAKVGNTWRVFGRLGGYHLHLEIQREINGRPAYSFMNCEASKTMWEVDIINKGLCHESLDAYIIDPIGLFEPRGAQQSVAFNQKKSDTLPRDVITTKTVSLNTVVDIPSSLQTISKTFDQFTFDIDAPQSLQRGQQGQITLRVMRNNTQFHGILPQHLSIITSNSTVRTSHRTLQHINGTQTVSIDAQNSWSWVVVIMYGNHQVARLNLTVHETN